MTDDTSKEPAPDIKWHYSLAGERHGPASEDSVIALIRANTLTRDSKVWNPTMLDWQPIATTALAGYCARTPEQPPPLTGSAVDNTVVWILAFAPLIGAVLEGFVSGATGIPRQSLWIVTLILNIGLSMADSTKLQKAGHDTSKMGAAWLIPVYLFKRAAILKQNNAYFITWCILFGLSLFGVL